MADTGEPIINGTNETLSQVFRDAFRVEEGVANKIHPNTYRLRFNKILNNFLCKDSDTNKWKINSTNGEYDVDCATSYWKKLMNNKSDFSPPYSHSSGKPKVVYNFEQDLQKLIDLKKDLLGEGAGGGQISKQGSKILLDDFQLSKSQKELMDKLDEVQKFKKDYAGDAKDITYIGKSKKQLELAYYIGGIGIMLLFILKAINYK